MSKSEKRMYKCKEFTRMNVLFLRFFCKDYNESNANVKNRVLKNIRKHIDNSYSLYFSLTSDDAFEIWASVDDSGEKFFIDTGRKDITPEQILDLWIRKFARLVEDAKIEEICESIKRYPFNKIKDVSLRRRKLYEQSIVEHRRRMDMKSPGPSPLGLNCKRYPFNKNKDELIRRRKRHEQSIIEHRRRMDMKSPGPSPLGLNCTLARDVVYREPLADELELFV